MTVNLHLQAVHHARLSDAMCQLARCQLARCHVARCQLARMPACRCQMHLARCQVSLPDASLDASLQGVDVIRAGTHPPTHLRHSCDAMISSLLHEKSSSKVFSQVFFMKSLLQQSFPSIVKIVTYYYYY